MKKTGKLLLSIMVLSLMLSACSNGNGGNEKDNSARDSVTISVNMIATNIDPHDISSLVHNQLKSHIYESFYHLDDTTGVYEQRLATGHEISGDGLVYTFHLREGVKFHNGEEMKASDVVFSFNRARKAASLTQQTEMIKSADVIDDYTVQITLNAPCAPFIHHTRQVNIISEKAVAETGEGNMASIPSPAGTGPYYITSYVPDVAVEYEAFADYYRGEASIQKIVCKPFVDTSTGLIAFENGELDFYTVPLANWEEISNSNKYDTELVAANHISFFRINHNRQQFSDIRVREAVALCLDRVAQNVIAYEGLAQEATKMFHPDYVFGAPQSGVTYDYNIDRARTLLAEAGYGDGIDIGTIKTTAGLYFEKMANSFQSSLAEAGITVKVEAMEQSASIADMMNNEFDIICTGYNCQFDYSFVTQIIDVCGGEMASPMYDDVRPLFEQAAAEQDSEIRKQLYQQIDDLLMEKYIFIPVFYKTQPYAWNQGLDFSTGSSYYYVYDWSWK